MIPFQVDPSWYERHWWRQQMPHRRSRLRARLIGAAVGGGRFVRAALQFVGYVLILIVSGDFRLPRRDDAFEGADRRVQPDGEQHQHDDRYQDGGGVEIVAGIDDDAAERFSSSSNKLRSSRTFAMTAEVPSA
jgi:hypothetical protein